MAVQQGYGKMAGTDALVFAYDTGDAVNSYKGEPTENLVNTNDNVYTLGNTNFPIAPPVKEVFNGSTQNGMSWTDHLRWYNETIPSGTTITISGWYMVYNTNASTPWDGSARLIIYSSAGYGGTVCNPDAWNTWKYFETTYTFPQDTTSFRLEDAGYDYYHTEDAANTTAYGCNYQVELKSHATPFVNGSRSATEGLLDLTGNEIIDLTNVSFDNNAEIAFDGTNDFIDLGSDVTIKTSGGWTVESVIYYDSVAGGYNNVTSPANFIGSDSITYNSWYWSVLSNKLALWNKSPGVWKYGSTTLQPDTWYHAVLVSYDSGTSYQMYLNGVAEGGDHTTYSWNSNYSGLKVRYIGRGNQTNTRLVNGNISVTKLYNKALTAAEVKSNFNNYKTRFNIA